MITEIKKIKAGEFAKALELELVSGFDDMMIELSTVNVNRPGLQLAGFFDYFATDRIQLIGNAELHYLASLSEEIRIVRLDTFFSHKVPCLIMSRNHEPSEEIVRAAEKYACPIFRSAKVTTPLTNSIVMFLNRELAPSVTKHAGLIDVYGMGVMIVGRSGIGKSETALELIKRGHRLVADDSVIVKQVNGNLIGSCPEIIKNFMELRGVGIIDVRAIYGIGAIMDEKSIDLVVELEEWDENKVYDRLGDEHGICEILDVKVPKIVVPVKPGRNLSIIVEVAARNTRLKAAGYDAALELIKRTTL